MSCHTSICFCTTRGRFFGLRRGMDPVTAYISSAISSSESGTENLARSFGSNANEPFLDLRFHCRGSESNLSGWRLERGLETEKVKSPEGGNGSGPTVKGSGGCEEEEDAGPSAEITIERWGEVRRGEGNEGMMNGRRVWFWIKGWERWWIILYNIGSRLGFLWHILMHRFV